jgi:Tfp pilus assembly pilus retraction ATPase PilT
MVVTPAIANLIREGKAPQVYSASSNGNEVRNANYGTGIQLI